MTVGLPKWFTLAANVKAIAQQFFSVVLSMVIPQIIQRQSAHKHVYGLHARC